jgi:predicted dehydrogenase
MARVLNFAVIGAGYFGKHYIRLLQELEGVSLKAVVSRSFSTFQKLSPLLLSDVRQSVDIQEILRDPAIDCVIIATPVSSHFSFAKDTMEAGKHVLLEKPMTATLREALALRAVVAQRNQAFMVGHQYLYNDYVRALAKDLPKIGKIRSVFAQHLSLGPLREGIDCFWEMAPHEFSLIDYFFGPLEIIRAKGSAIGMREGERGDFAACEVLFDSGMLLTLAISWFFPEKTRRMAFLGEKGIAIFDDARARDKLAFFMHPYPEEPIPAGSSFFFDASKDRAEIPAREPREPLRNQLEHFIECVRRGQTPLTDIEHGVRVIRMLDAVRKAMD